MKHNAAKDKERRVFANERQAPGLWSKAVATVMAPWTCSHDSPQTGPHSKGFREERRLQTAKEGEMHY